MIEDHQRLETVARIRRFRGLIADAQGTVVGFRGRKMLQCSPPYDQPQDVGVLPSGWKEKLAVLPFAARLLRMEIYRMVRTSAGTDIATSRRGVLRRGIDQRTFSVTFDRFQGTRPISLCTDGQGRVYFGEYFGNPERQEVHIFCSEDDGRSWERCYTFPAGTIRHVHGLEYDVHRDKIWVMSGDYGDEAQIALASPQFSTYDIITQGGQTARACSGICMPDAFLYATDTPLEQNHVFRLNPESGQRTSVAQVQQSTFFMGQACGGSFLSTVVEPSEVHPTRSVHVWYSPEGSSWQEVYAAPRDRWSLKYFQYPLAFIAQGPVEAPHVFLSFRGTRGTDGDCLVGRIVTTE